MATGVIDMLYNYNGGVNLYSRTDNLINQKEQFSYDLPNRLTNWDVHQSSTNNPRRAGYIHH